MQAGDKPTGRETHARRSRAGLSCRAAFCTLLCSCVPVTAKANALPYNNFGSPGLIEMPSARMAPDGELSLNASAFENNQRYALSFSALPWLDVSFRYSGLQHFQPAYPTYYDRSFALKLRLWDETALFPAIALGINDLVGTGIYGGEYLVVSKQFGPVDASLGLGWGRLASANGFKNPLGAISSGFYNRTNAVNNGGNFSTGTLFHGPMTGVFGGLVWHTPIPDLSLSAEYSSDAYSAEAAAGNLKPSSQINYGIAYRLSNGIGFALNWLYGRTIAGNITIALDPTKPQFLDKIGTAELPLPPVRSPEQQQRALNNMLGRGKAIPAAFSHNALADALWRMGPVDDVTFSGRTLRLMVPDGVSDSRCLNTAQLLHSYDTSVTSVELIHSGGAIVRCATPSAPDSDFHGGVFVGASFDADDATPNITRINASGQPPSAAAITARIKSDARKQRLTVEAVFISRSDIQVYYRNDHYFLERDALKRLTAVLMKDSPPEIESFRLVTLTDGMPQKVFKVLRSPAERAVARTAEPDLFGADSGTVVSDAPIQNPALAAARRHSYPRLSWDIFPQFRQQLFDPSNPLAIQLLAAANATVELRPGLSLTGQGELSLYDNFNVARASNSVLPHVRTDFVRYFTKGKNGIASLEADYEFRLSPQIFAIARAGYLESMFAGAGGEILWRPENQRWAIGIDAYQVWQRDFDRMFGLQKYRQTTGHVSLYYASPWYDLNFTVRAGQYLAGDRGLTFEITRRFATGVEIGAFATKTNVSSNDFGEGSFDKGIIIRIPLGWRLPIETQGQANFDLRPVQRDGGQRLSGDTLLYDRTRRASDAEYEP